MDLKLNTSNDLSIDLGDLETVTGSHEAGQRIKDRLQTFKNEWFLNLAIGLDYFGRIFVKNPRPSIVASHIRNEILKAASGNITAFSYELVNRVLKVEYTMILDSGEILEGTF